MAEWKRATPKAPSPAAPEEQWQRAAPGSATTTQVDELGQDDDPFFTGTLQGASLGWWDELMARAESAIADTNYRDNWNRRQAELDRYRRLAPKRMLGGEIAGALPIMYLTRGLAPIAAMGAVQGIGQGSRPYDDPNYENKNASVILPALDALTGPADALTGYGIMKGVSYAGGKLTAPIAPYARKAGKWVLEKAARPLF